MSTEIKQTTETAPATLVITRTLAAPVDRVFRAWTEPDHIKNWFGCGKTAEIVMTQDFRVGGDFRIEMHCTDGEVAVVNGTFKEIEPNKRLVYTWSNNSQEYPASNTLVTIDFVTISDTTEIQLKHSNFTTEVVRQGHTMGWDAAFDKFAALFE